MKRVLGNVQKGYAEVYYYPDDDVKEEHLLYSGYVALYDVPAKVDFHNDTIEYAKRWFAALYFGRGYGRNGFELVGRTNTGYASRSLALRGIEQAIIDIYGPGYTDEPKEVSEGLITSLGGIPDEEEF